MWSEGIKQIMVIKNLTLLSKKEILVRLLVAL